MSGERARVPIEELIDPAVLDGAREPSPARIRAALPPGWVLEDDLRHARRDGRLLFRQGWVLIAGLAAFGAAAIGLFWMTFPSGWRGLARGGILALVLILLGGVVAPLVTRALHRR